MRPPLLVVVTGMPSSGKTTVAEALAQRLRLPLVAKDDIKESLYETLGGGDIAWSGRLGNAAYELIFDLARRTLSAGSPLIVEANFFREHASNLASLPAHRSVQVHCDAPLSVLVERYAARERHAGHHDREKIKELPARYENGAHAPLDLPGELIRLDTTTPVDFDLLAARIGRVPVTLRPAGLDDRELLRRLLHDYLFEFDGRTGPYPYFDAYWEEPERLPFLIDVDGEAAGLCLIRVRDGGWSIAEFYVVSEQRHAGIGRSAVAALADHARSDGAAHLEAKVHPDNEEVLPFWLAAGFDVIAEPGVIVTRRLL